MKIDLESCNKYIVVSEVHGQEQTMTFTAMDQLADYVEVERGIVAVYKVSIIKLPEGVYTRKTTTNH